jgi:hypothetical protein
MEQQRSQWQKLVYREDKSQPVEKANEAVMEHCRGYIRYRIKHGRDAPDNGDGECNSKTRHL